MQERDTLLLQFQDLKAQMSRLHSTEHQRLVKLTMLCDAAFKDLKAYRNKVTLTNHIRTLSSLSASGYVVIGRLRVRISAWATSHQGLLSLPNL